MNEEANAVDTSTEEVSNINSEEGSVTAADVAEVLNLPTQPASTEEETEEDESDGDDNPDEGNDEPVEATGGDQTPDSGDSDKSNVPASKEPVVTEETAVEPTFAVEIEDANGVKYTVSPDDNLEDVLAEFEPKNNGQVLQLMRDLYRLTGEKAQHEATQAEEAQAAALEQQVTEIQASFDKEVSKLQGSKRLPVTTDGKDSERLTEVYKYMNEENTRRMQEGIAPLRSVEDALDKMELKEHREQAAQAKKDAKTTARKNGGLVGGSSAPATSGEPAYSGGARTANEALRSMGML